MVNEIKYTTISRVLDSLTDHPMLKDITLEQVVRYTLRFIGLHGHPEMYEDKIEELDIHDFRGLLPCDLIRIIQVKDLHSGICLRSMTDSFIPTLRHGGKGPKPPVPHELPNDYPVKGYGYIPPLHLHPGELTFKTQGRVIFTSFPEGRVEIAYKAIPIDEDGYPKLIDNEVYLAALESYIKEQVFTVKYDMGKISSSVLQNAKQEYSWRAGQLHSEFMMPSESEMESLTRMRNTLIPSMYHFDRGFRELGDREYIRRH
jgi:hypothetical protein